MDEHAQTVGNFLDDRHTESRRRIAALEAELAAERKRREAVLRVVNEQACDEGLWFRAEHVTEDYLQAALRRLHAAIEGEG